MQKPRDAMEVLDRDFLEARCKILEIAAILDRIDRAPARHGEHPDVRLGQLRQGVEALLVPGAGAGRDDPAHFFACVRSRLAAEDECAAVEFALVGGFGLESHEFGCAAETGSSRVLGRPLVEQADRDPGRIPGAG